MLAARPIATRRRSGTPSTTDSFTKHGVGLVLKAPQPTALSKLTVNSVGTSFDAQIKGEHSLDGARSPISPATSSRSARARPSASTRTGKKYRYYMVWLRLPVTSGGQAQISEVTART